MFRPTHPPDDHLVQLLGKGSKEDGERHGEAPHHSRQPGRLAPATVFFFMQFVRLHQV